MADGPNVWDVGEDIIVELTVNDPTSGFGLIDQESYMDLVFQRLSDNKYWTGTTWSTTRTLLDMTQADRTNQPGRYTYTLPGTGGNIQADKYLAHVRLENPPLIEGDAYEIHVSRTQAVRFYEAEPA